MTEPHIIAKAIKRLFDALSTNWSFEQWANFLGLGTTPEEIERWTTCTTDIGPKDWQMTMVLRHCERVQGSEKCPDMPDAIANFYDVLHEIEEDPSKAQGFITRRPGEQMCERLTRFANNDWDRNVLSYQLHIHPSRRHEFINSVIALVDKLRCLGPREPGEVTETHVINFACRLCHSADVRYEMVARGHERVTCEACGNVDEWRDRRIVLPSSRSSV